MALLTQGLFEIKDSLGRFETFYADPKIGNHEGMEFGTDYYILMKNPENAELWQEYAVLAHVPEAMRFCIDRNPRSDVVVSEGVMYGEKGITLVKQPVFDPKKHIIDASKYIYGAENMVYDENLGIYRVDTEQFSKDSSKPGLYVSNDGKQMRVFFSADTAGLRRKLKKQLGLDDVDMFLFPAYKDNEKLAMPYTDKENTLLALFDPENHGWPIKFTNDPEKVKKACKELGIYDSLSKEGFTEEDINRFVLIKFYRLGNCNYGLRSGRRGLGDDDSGLFAFRYPGGGNDYTGGRLVSGLLQVAEQLTG
ncbi:MAG: hypothetical protein HZB65_04255 [Candidatus Aenigmarchaeota archaeon]|nr:hypothetical protein [Candidatus Aenigmarchaeota archaeon]